MSSLVVLREPNAQLDQAALSKTEGIPPDRKQVMTHVAKAVSMAQLEFLQTFDTEMQASCWNDLAAFVRRTRDVARNALGPDDGAIRLQMNFLTAAQDLVSAASDHARLIGHVEVLQDRSATIASDNAALRPSLRSVRDALETYRKEIEKLAN